MKESSGKKRIILGIGLFLAVLALAAVFGFFCYCYVQNRSAFEFVDSRSQKAGMGKLRCLFEKPIAEDLTLVVFCDQNERAWIQVIQKGSFDDYYCGTTTGSFPLIDTEDRTMDDIKENDFIRIAGGELARDPGKLHGQETEKFFLAWGMIYSDTVAGVEIWGKAADIVTVPDCPARIVYYVAEDYEEPILFNYGTDIKVSYR